MKTLLKSFLTATAICIILSLTACSGPQYKDGVYSAQSPEFAASGWKEIMEVTIENGEISKINWDAIYKDDSIPIRKKQYSKSGLYGMLRVGAAGEWYDQAFAAEQFVLKNGIDSFTYGDDGYTDAITGCTIHVDAFDTLIRECLRQAQR